MDYNLWNALMVKYITYITNTTSDFGRSQVNTYDIFMCYRLFPNVNIITEVHEASNMRFMHFQARDTYTQEIARLEKASSS